jgi:hypothetical protein
MIVPARKTHKVVTEKDVPMKAHPLQMLVGDAGRRYPQPLGTRFGFTRS